MTFKVVIAGSSKFDNFKLLVQSCDYLLKNKTDIEIVSGKQITISNGKKYGADYLGEVYAELRGYPVKPFPADWDKLGRSAGPIRNEIMASYCDAVIVFWDGYSRGTKDMRERAIKYKKPLRTIYF